MTTETQKTRRELLTRLMVSFVTGIALGGVLANAFPAGEGARWEGNALPAYATAFAASFLLPVVADLCKRRKVTARSLGAGLAGAAVGSLTALCSLLINV